MKSIVMHKTSQSGKNEELQLANEVKETLAIDAKDFNRKKNFTAADLWHRNKSRQSASDRIRRWNLN
jgi:hypothetical protein